MGRGKGLKGLPWVPEEQAQGSWPPSCRLVLTAPQRCSQDTEQDGQNSPGEKTSKTPLGGHQVPWRPSEALGHVLISPWASGTPAFPLVPIYQVATLRGPRSRLAPSPEPPPLHPGSPSRPGSPDTPGPLRDRGGVCTCVCHPPPSPGLRLHCSSWTVTGWGQGPLVRPPSGMEQSLPRGTGDTEQRQVGQLLPGLVPDCPGSLWVSGSHSSRLTPCPTPGGPYSLAVAVMWQVLLTAQAHHRGSCAASGHLDPQWALQPAIPCMGRWLHSDAFPSPYRA